MKQSDIDWKILRWSMVILFVCLALSGAMVSGSFYFKDKMLKEYNRNNASFRMVSNKYFAVDEEEKLIKKYFPIFIKLYEKGVLGREFRLNWVETLRQAGEELKIPGLSYDIRSQELYTPAFPVVMGRYTLFRSTMSLDMQLLHEGDMFSLFEFLDKNASGAYNVSNCKIVAQGKGISDDPSRANINVKCELIWHSIKLADGTELKVTV